MAGGQQRCDCEIDREAARKGDLPPVCVWCGEATNLYFPAPLFHRLKKVPLLLPLCHPDKNHWRRRDWAFTAILASVAALILGLLLVVLTVTVLAEEKIIPDAVVKLLFAVSSGLYLLGILGGVVSLAAYIILTVRSIQIRRLGRQSVTLKRVAPEFVEALRVYRQRKVESDASSPLPEREADP